MTSYRIPPSPLLTLIGSIGTLIPLEITHLNHSFTTYLPPPPFPLPLLPPFPLKLIWNGFSPLQVQAFIWIASHFKMNTMDILQKRLPNMISPHISVLCRKEGEFGNYIMIHYAFSRKIWEHFLHPLNLCWVMPYSSLDLLYHWRATHPSKRCCQFWSLLLHGFFWDTFGKSATKESLKAFLGRFPTLLTPSPLKLHLVQSLSRSSLIFRGAIYTRIGSLVSFTMLNRSCTITFFFFLCG